MLKYLPLLLLASVLAFVSLQAPASADDNGDGGGGGPPFLPVRMVGSGSVPDPNFPGQSITFSLSLSCDGLGPDSLVINFRGHTYVHQNTNSASCTSNNPADPDPGGRYQGSGTGLCDGAPANALLIDLIDRSTDPLAAGQDAVRFTVQGNFLAGCFFAIFHTILESGDITLITTGSDDDGDDDGGGDG